MSTIKDSLYFTYNGKSCKDFGLIQVNLDNGMFEEQFGASREIIETTVRGSDTPLFHRVEESPLEFEMTIAFERDYTDEDIDNVVLWLFQDIYKPLFFETKPNKIYYCMPVGDATIAHNGLKQGYITLLMRCKSSRVVSPTITTPTYNLSTNTGKYPITIKNEGHVTIYPEISIRKIGDGNITITRDNGEIFEIRNLTNLEDIYINCEKEIIETDIVGVYRYENVVGDYYDMELLVGDNIFYIDGTCEIAFRYVYKYKF